MNILSFRTMNLALSLFALVNTQNALLMAHGTPNQKADGLFIVIAGAIAIFLGIGLIILIIRRKKNRENI